MRPIPQKVKTELENDERMKVCALAPFIEHLCSKKIDWHHNLIYKSRQSNNPRTILGICTNIHDKANNKEIKERLDWIMVNQMTPRDFEEFSKSGLRQRKVYLNKKYGQV